MSRAFPGWQFLQIPGPSNVPARVREAIARPTTDHRGPDFPELTGAVLGGMQRIVRTQGHVVTFPASGTGAWEAALVNLFSPGDRILMFETGQFAVEWAGVATRLGLSVDLVPGDWRTGVDPETIERRLAEDHGRTFKAVAVVHNETSTGVVSRIPLVRQAIDRVGHDALLLVDTISSLGSVDYRHDEWGVDVTVAASQKGLMLPPGLAFNAVSKRALEASARARLPRSYWDWQRMVDWNAKGYFPFTPATNLLFGLREAIAMLEEEGLENVFQRHTRHGEATRRAVERWGLEVQCVNPDEYSGVLTGVRVPDGFSADTFRALAWERYRLSLGAGLGKIRGKVFRIGHLGDFNDLMLAATLAGVESGLALSGVPIRRGGVEVAMQYLESAGGPDAREEAPREAAEQVQTAAGVDS